MINTSATACYTLSLNHCQLQLHLQRVPCVHKIAVLPIAMPIVVPVGIILHRGDGRSLSKRGVLVFSAAHI